MADKYIYAVARIRALEMSLMSQAAIEQPQIPTRRRFSSS